MDDIISLIEKSKRVKKELIASTVRMPAELYSFIEGLSDELEISRHEVTLKLLEQGAAVAKKALVGAELATSDFEPVTKMVSELNPTNDATKDGFHILNTNKAHTVEDHEWMTTKGIAAAFYDPWKFHIDKIREGDVVFLYENGKGIVAYGRGTGKVKVQEHRGDPDECHYQELQGFTKLDKPVAASVLRKVLNKHIVLMRTMSQLADGQKVLDYIEGNI
jgi:hypothetical protein